MANRRMFSKTVTESDPFFELSIEAMALYFVLGMSADDDGILNNLQRQTILYGISKNALKELIEKGFVIELSNSIYAIAHWKINNGLRKDRYQPTKYKTEFERLGLKDNVYYLKTDNGYNMEPNGIQTVSNMEPQLDKTSIDKTSLDKTSLDKTSIDKTSIDKTSLYYTNALQREFKERGIK